MSSALQVTRYTGNFYVAYWLHNWPPQLISSILENYFHQNVIRVRVLNKWLVFQLTHPNPSAAKADLENRLKKEFAPIGGLNIVTPEHAHARIECVSMLENISGNSILSFNLVGYDLTPEMVAHIPYIKLAQGLAGRMRAETKAPMSTDDPRLPGIMVTLALRAERYLGKPVVPLIVGMP